MLNILQGRCLRPPLWGVHLETERAGTLSRPAARMKVDKLRRHLGKLTRELKVVEHSVKAVVALAVELHEGQAHTALGYGSWREMIETENLQLLGLAPDDFNLVMREMVAKHFSGSAVGPIIGRSDRTGQRAVDKFIRTAGTSEGIPSRVRGLDGKVRDRTRGANSALTSGAVQGQESSAHFPDNADVLFDVEGFLSSIGADEVADETADQIVMVEAISQDLQQAFDSLVAVEPEQRHASQVRKLLSHTEAILDQRRRVASRWGIPV